MVSVIVTKFSYFGQHCSRRRNVRRVPILNPVVQGRDQDALTTHTQRSLVAQEARPVGQSVVREYEQPISFTYIHYTVCN